MLTTVQPTRSVRVEVRANRIVDSDLLILALSDPFRPEIGAEVVLPRASWQAVADALAGQGITAQAEAVAS